MVPRRGSRAVRAWLVALLLGALARLARADEGAPAPEPPPEAGEGDYAWELPDSLTEDEFELAVGAFGRGTGTPRRSQRVSFQGGGARGTLRDGDPELGAGRVESPFAGGRLAAGQLSPLWGRGLVLGGAAEPWARAPEDRGQRARFRGRSGGGVLFDSRQVGLLAGRFAKRDLAGMRLSAGPVSLGALASRAEHQSSVAFEAGPHAAEWATDARGRWRAEASLRATAGDTRLSLRVRGGQPGFRSLAEPARSGPARALAASAAREWGALRVTAFGALWAWRAGVDGARSALEVDAGLGNNESMALGVLEQQGPRRDPAPSARPIGTRQGWWCEWRGGPPGARLALRHELWGARAFARDAVRRVAVARGEWLLPFGARVAVTHAVWRARSGESLVLPEAGADRLVLRSVSGAGTRTLPELRLPFASGQLRLAVTLVTGGTRAAAPPAWTVEWSRRSRLTPRAAVRHEGSQHEIRGAHGPPDHGGVVRHAGARQGPRGQGPEHHPPGDR